MSFRLREDIVAIDAIGRVVSSWRGYLFFLFFQRVLEPIAFKRGPGRRTRIPILTRQLTSGLCDLLDR
jgi:hypothetical protein